MLAERLRTTRDRLGLSQQAVAASTGIPRSAISDIERGQRRVDSLELKRLAVVYGRSVEYLLGEDDEGEDQGSLRILTRAHAGMTADDRAKLVAFAEFLRHHAHTARVEHDVRRTTADRPRDGDGVG
ncbi:helix-turn-helix domain-containing protein [Saccharothrix hoggarensis]|uniref:Helix-turn-helix domain-containing protein n=1 Tax=Saccharothrix hoggarensis TaxID=913853 RepID=A0ABW3QD79_9PSEU